MLKNNIVLVSFPFDDFSTTKVRPAICLTNKIGKFNHIVIAFITSQIPNNPEKTDLLIKVEEHGFRNTGLKITSTIKLHKLVTIPASLIKRELGKFPKSREKDLNDKIKILFNL